MSKDMDPGMTGMNRLMGRRGAIKAVLGLGLGIIATNIPDLGVGNPPTAEAAPQPLTPEQLQQTVEYTWQPTIVTKEWISQLANRQWLSASGCVKNQEGELVRQFVVKPKHKGNNTFDNKLYDTLYDSQSRQMQEYYPVSDIPVGWVTKLLALEDGTVISGGETQPGNGDTSLAISFDQANKWKQVPWSFGSQGMVKDMIRLPGSNKVIIGTAHYHASSRSMFVGEIDKANETIQINPTDISTFSADLSIASYDPKANKVVLYAAGTEAQQRGLLVYEIDLTTNKGTVRSVLENLGTLEAKGEFTDDNGNKFITAVNNDPNILNMYIIDGRSLNVVQTIPFKGILNGRGVTNYHPDSLQIGVTHVVKTKTGERKLVFTGNYGQVSKENAINTIKPIVGNFVLGKDPKETLKINDFAGDINVESGMINRDVVHLTKTPDKNDILVAYAYGIGMIVYDIEQNKVFFPNKGLDRTSGTRPNSAPRTYWEKYGAAIPAVRQKPKDQ